MLFCFFSRRDIQPNQFEFDENDRNRFLKLFDAANSYRSLLEDFSNKLRKSAGIAGDYYEWHSTRIKREDQLIDLIIALEALFSPAKEGEHRFRISQRAAILLGGSNQERKDIFAFIRNAYDARSRLVHEGVSPFILGPLNEDELPKLGDYVREAILRIITLVARGEKDKEKFQKELDQAALDQDLSEKIRSQSEIENFLRESFPEQ